MYAYKEYLMNGNCPYCKRDLSIYLNNLDNNFKHNCVDCEGSLTIVPNRALFAEIYGPSDSRVIGEVSPIGKDCCGV